MLKKSFADTVSTLGKHLIHPNYSYALPYPNVYKV